MLCALYLSTALGIGADESFAEFDKSTSKKRKHAFIAFAGSIFSFMSSFVVMVCLAVSNRFNDKIITITLENILPFLLMLLTVWAFFEFRDIVLLATEQIFNPWKVKPNIRRSALAETRLHTSISLRNTLQDIK
mmetsp:Transcript_19919/g.22944  ORF Transcript_19919/g.22944 Transcript_19919/m.22944 type:complete len:134 (-) Transcript_19919:310-711(-)